VDGLVNREEDQAKRIAEKAFAEGEPRKARLQKAVEKREITILKEILNAALIRVQIDPSESKEVTSLGSMSLFSLLE
jgi:hypothetical protein